MINFIFLFLTLFITPAAAQCNGVFGANQVCATGSSAGIPTATAPISTAAGGTGGASFTANLPIIGNGTGALAQGTRSGSTTSFATTTGTLTNGHCVQFDGSGNLIDAGGACTTGGGGGTVSSASQYNIGYYATAGTVISGNTTITTDASNHLISPTLAGGSATSSILTLESTTGAGATDLVKILTGSQVERLRVDSSGNITTGAAAAYTGLFSITSPIQFNGSTAQIARWSNDGNGSLFETFASRSTTIGTHTSGALSTNDKVGLWSAGGDDGTSFNEVGRIQFTVDASVSTGIVPGRMTISTANSSGVNTEHLRIDSNGVTTVSGSLLSPNEAPVTAFGAKCDGSTNDTAAFNTAFASGYKTILVIGVCNVTTLNTTPSGMTLRGRNRNESIIQTTSATGNVMSLGEGNTVKDLGFKSTVTRTAGDYILIQNRNLSQTNQGPTTLDSLYFENYFNAIEINNSNSVHARDLQCYMTAAIASNDCLLFDGVNSNIANVDDTFSDVWVWGGGASGAEVNGVEIQAAGDISFYHLQVVLTGIGFLVDANGSRGVGQSVLWLSCVQCLFDTNGTGALIDPTNGGIVYTTRFMESWISSNTNYGIFLNTDTGHSSEIGQVDIQGSIVSNNGNDNVLMNDNSNINNVNIIGSTLAGPATNSIYVGTNGPQSVRIVDNKIGQSAIFPAPTTGIFFNGSATFTDFTIENNDLSGTTTSVSITSGVAITGFINHNVGYHSGAPGLSFCGSSTIVGNDYGGVVTGSGNTGCVITFANSFQKTPSCTWTDLTGNRSGSTTTLAAAALTVGGLTSGDSISYTCTPSPNS